MAKTVYGGKTPNRATKRKFTRLDYIQEGNARGLEFVGMVVPPTVFDTATWKCKRCGTIRKVSLFRMKQGDRRDCVCLSGKKLVAQDYHNLARYYGIEWVGEMIPRSPQEKTLWRGKNGNYVEARYNLLSYSFSRRMAERLGVDYAEIEQKENQRRSNNRTTS